MYGPSGFPHVEAMIFEASTNTHKKYLAITTSSST